MKKENRYRRHRRITKKIKGNAISPRLVVFRSKKHISLQAINDQESQTLFGCSTQGEQFKIKKIRPTDKQGAKEMGKIAADNLLKLGIKSVSFDRGGYKYHGRIRSLAEGLREGGIKF